MSRTSLKEKTKLRDRCVVLVEIVRQLGRIYSSPSVNETQRHYIETIIGAALWYLPTSKELWTGAISIRTLEEFHPDSDISKPRMTEDHEYPRKVSAVELMRQAWEHDDPAGEMLRLYLERYGRFNYITPTENKVLVKHQRTGIFEMPSIAYERAGIRLVRADLKELKRISRREGALIEAILKRNEC